jgi:hypothetical protein
MQQDELFPKNAFDLVKFNEASRQNDKANIHQQSKKFDGFSDNTKDSLIKIESLIERGELSEARQLINLNFHDEGDPLKKYCDRLISEYLTPDRYEDVTSPSIPYHGSDMKPFFLEEAKVIAGVATKDEYESLLTFWHSYPHECGHKFRAEIFKQQLRYKNFHDINVELIFLLINEESRPEYKFFYVYFAYRYSYIDSSTYREYRVRQKNPTARTLGKEIFRRFESNNFLDLSGL